MSNPFDAWRRLPRLVRFLFAHGAVGFGLSAVLVAALILLDPQDVGRLLLTAAGHWWPAVVLWFFTGATFGAVQIGVATMLLDGADDRPAPPERGSAAPAGLIPIRVRAGQRR
jgi:hypothetical protein